MLNIRRKPGEAVILHDDEGEVLSIRYLRQEGGGGTRCVFLRIAIGGSHTFDLMIKTMGDNVLRLGIEAEDELLIDREELLEDIADEAELYHYNVQWSGEDSSYIGRVTEWPGLAAHGETPPQALSEIQAAVKFSIQDCIAQGDEYPKPLAKP